MKFIINLAILKFKRGLARLMHPLFHLCLQHFGTSDDDLHYYEREVCYQLITNFIMLRYICTISII